MDWVYKIRCDTCKELKHDTAFQFTTKRFLLFFTIWWDKLDTSECLDCKYPYRWDEVKKYFDDTYKNNR